MTKYNDAIVPYVWLTTIAVAVVLLIIAVMILLTPSYHGDRADDLPSHLR